MIKILVLFFLMAATAAHANDQCSYTTYKWSVHLKKAVEFQRINKLYSQLESYERDTVTGCTVCEQDQREITMQNIKSFKVCHIIADPVQAILTELIEQGESINQIIAYRVGMTRGDVDQQGNRTVFSNHSFGVAIDINPQHNGLYDNCLQFNNTCKLIKGGPWQPGVDKYSLYNSSEIVRAFKSLGFKWGGEIAGKQKDFMHFSLSGY